ncbi:nuclear transport factor 2 family protein [Parvibaculum sp.]|uniref:nuclear transport factor 2 family protein n=1 Tax=Parvibaculum sp. TaxID=2024848 RepID=UPI0034A0302B
MAIVQKFIEQRQIFEAAYEDDNWAPLAPYFHEEVVYEVINMPFHCRIEGRTVMIEGLKRSIERFDKLCVRAVGLGAKLYEEGNNVFVHGGIRFQRADAPVLESSLWEIATYRDGLIVRLMDIYDAGDKERFERWMTEWGDGPDPSYI